MTKFKNIFLFITLLLSMHTYASSSVFNEFKTELGSYLYTLHADKEVDSIIVLYDSRCSFCKLLLLKSIPTLIRNGIGVSFLPYPKNGVNSSAANEMINAWQWENPIAKLNFPELKNKKTHRFTKKDLMFIYKFVNEQINISGTPVTLLSNGEYIEGVYKPLDLIKLLNK